MCQECQVYIPELCFHLNKKEPGVLWSWAPHLGSIAWSLLCTLSNTLRMAPVWNVLCAVHVAGAVPGSQQSGMEGVALKGCFSFARCQNKNQPAASKLSTLWGGCSTHFRQHEIHNCARVKQSAQDILNQLQTSARQLSRRLMYKPIGGKCLDILLKKSQAQQSVILLETCLTPFSV